MSAKITPIIAVPRVEDCSPLHLSSGFNLPFAEQIDFFRQKLNLPTERWDDIWQAAHDRAFVVAGAMKADLLNDLRLAVDKGVSSGTTLKTFREDFEAIVAKHGWTGWTGEGTDSGRAWRTRVIYETNLRTSYAAGRWTQLHDPEVRKRAPYWAYWRHVHADGVLSPRPQHKAWGDTRCVAERGRWLSFLGLTKRMFGRLAASQMAWASAKLFLLPWTKGLTNCGEISFASWPITNKRRAIQCAPAQASITTRQIGKLASCVSIWLRESFLRNTMRP